MKTIAALFLLSIATAAFAQPPPLELGARKKAEQVSIIALIGNPERYNGKAVRVIGAVNFAFEANAICLHHEDLDKGLSSNCLWIEADPSALGADHAMLQRYNGHYVLLEGTFDKGNLGHMGAYSGAIVSCWRILLMSSADEG